MGVFNSIFPVLVMLLIGYLSRNLWIKDDKFWSSINKLIYYLMFPCLMVYDIGRANIENTNFSYIPILVGIVILFMGTIWLLKPLFKDQQLWVSFIQGSVRYNSYVFIGVTFYYIGHSVMPIIAVITAFLIITTNVISVIILNIYSPNKKNIKNTIYSTMKNPLIVSCILGLIINKIAVYFPVIIHIIWINNTLNSIGLASLALSLMGVGASLKIKINREKILSILLCSFIKLILLPAFVIMTLTLFRFNSLLIEVCAIYAGSPCSSNAAAMSQSMGGDYESMSLIISVQTVLSLFTLGAWLMLFSHGYI